MKQSISLLVVLVAMLTFSQCSVNRQLAEAKVLGDCKYSVASADSIFLSGIDVRQFKKLDDINPLKYPQLAAGVFAKSVPLSARLNLDIYNPTNRKAGINQLEYKILLADQELFNGFLNQRIEVPAGGGTTRVPVRLRANAFQLLTDEKTRDAFANFIQSLSGGNNAQPSKLTIKIKPTLALGGKKVNYPGFITIDQEMTSKLLLGK
ncbi:LEA type 2 family protein [Tellurirhabdus bombi]|uniref:LEA type 2 family protein n=1 Tax=Tellurirhabdus bombi TaxID=2907205 RepID=UPI001F2CF846|nr:LEA type 2 family protein [Tellurirhabdus bombi]